MANTYWYGKALTSAFSEEIHTGDTFKVALFADTYTPAKDTDQYYNLLSGELSTANGYTAGGATLTNVSFTYTGATNIFNMDADDVTWTSTTITARYAVVYDSTPATNKPLICYIDFGQNESTTGEDFKITWDANGICKLTVTAPA